jgi:hypothetical protein
MSRCVTKKTREMFSTIYQPQAFPPPHHLVANTHTMMHHTQLALKQHFLFFLVVIIVFLSFPNTWMLSTFSAEIFGVKVEKILQSTTCSIVKVLWIIFPKRGLKIFNWACVYWYLFLSNDKMASFASHPPTEIPNWIFLQAHVIKPCFSWFGKLEDHTKAK